MQPKGIRWMQLDDAYALSFSIMSLLWAHGQAQFVCAGTTAHALQMVLHLICNNTNNIMVLEHNRNNSIPAPHHIYMYVSVHGVLNILWYFLVEEKSNDQESMCKRNSQEFVRRKIKDKIKSILSYARCVSNFHNIVCVCVMVYICIYAWNRIPLKFSSKKVYIGLAFQYCDSIHYIIISHRLCIRSPSISLYLSFYLNIFCSSSFAFWIFTLIFISKSDSILGDCWFFSVSGPIRVVHEEAKWNEKRQ